MKRRDFLTTAGAVGVASMSGIEFARAADNGGNKKFIELRTYTVANAEKKEKLLEVLDNAFIPALNRLGIKPVGVLWTDKQTNENNDAFDLTVFVIIPHDNAECFLGYTAKLLADKQFLKDAAPILETTSKDPLYTTLKSTLMTGFNNCPTVEVPTLVKDRILQLRFYKSFNFERNSAKVHMFDEGGELPLFRKCKMNPVFFGETVFGDFMPNLTYMLGFENEEARKAAWKMFGESDEWSAIKGKSMYNDTATSIINILLKPSKGSQI